MNTLQQDQFELLSRSSRRAGWITLVGAVIVFGALGYSSVKLVHQKQEQLKALSRQEEDFKQRLAGHMQEDEKVQKELSTLNDQLKGLRAEKTSLDTTIQTLRSQTNTYRESIREVRSEAKQSRDPGPARVNEFETHASGVY